MESKKLNTIHYTLKAKKAFSLVEAIVALIILALVCSSVLSVCNRCTVSATDLTLRMQAFEVARENMETLLSGDSVSEMVEYGNSDKYPEIQWQTVVETFYEPITARMWIRGTCSAEYTDTEGSVQTVELTHWLTDLTKQQLLQILEENFAKTLEEAAEYAGVDVETIQQWVDNGMPETEQGYFVKDQLDLYKRTDGVPTIEDQRQQPEADTAPELEEPFSKDKLPIEFDPNEMTAEQLWIYLKEHLNL